MPDKAEYDIEAVFTCIARLLEIDPNQIGKKESIRLINDHISNLMKCESVQVLEVVNNSNTATEFLKYYPEDKQPEKVVAGKGINRFCVVNQRFFIAESLEHEQRIAHGRSGAVKGAMDLREEHISYIMVKPDKDEESALFYPLVRGRDCIGTIKLCDFTQPERFTLEDLYIFRPVADVIASILHSYAVIDDLDKRNQEYETLAAEATEAIEKLQIGERLTYQFLAATSHLHDLAGLLGGMASDREEFRSVIQLSNLSKKEKLELIEIIERYSKHREEAFKKVRELLRDRPKQETLYIKPYNVKDLINDQLEVYEKQLEQEQIRLKKSLKAADIHVSVDASAFKYVIRILLNNAIRALHDGPNRPRSLGVHAGLKDGNLVIRVADNGIGIERKDQKRIFEAFFTTKKDGSGIGLWWAKKTIEEEHGGEVVLERSYPKAGSTFRITLPT